MVPRGLRLQECQRVPIPRLAAASTPCDRDTHTTSRHSESSRRHATPKVKRSGHHGGPETRFAPIAVENLPLRAHGQGRVVVTAHARHYRRLQSGCGRQDKEPRRPPCRGNPENDWPGNYPDEASDRRSAGTTISEPSLSIAQVTDRLTVSTASTMQSPSPLFTRCPSRGIPSLSRRNRSSSPPSDTVELA